MPCIAARCFSAALGLLAFSGQAQQAPALPSPDQQRAFASCRVQLRGLTADSGVAGDAFDRFMAGIVPDMSVLPLLDTQPEFSTPIWDYLAPLVDDARIADGKAMLAQHTDTFAQVAQSRGVDAATVAAVWGVESDYGRVQGKRPLLVSLSTLSCFGRRQGFFRGELMATLALLQAGDLSPDGLTGSWAGAFGQTQFMPSTFARYAVDFDGDGKRDLYHSLPDVFASTANFLKQAGWRRGEPWAIEVVLPPSFDVQLAGRTKKRPTNEWLAMSLSRADGKPWPRTLPEKAALLLPAGRQGPALLAFPNYDAIFRYNAAESYALAIGLLYDALKDPLKAARFDPKQPFVQAWPTDDPPLTRSETLELQERLSTLGYDPGTIDGVAGAQTREALSRFQQECGGQALEADGWPGTKALEQLRRFEGGCNKTH